MFNDLWPLLTILSLFHTASSTVYYVIPDDHYTTNNNTYILQHYLDNVRKYFTSHTQLRFLPGQYYLNTDLIIQHVSNLSLIGNRTNEVISSVIKCTSPAGIVVVGSNNIVIANIVMKECGSDFNTSIIRNHSLASQCKLSLFVLKCWKVAVKYFYSIWEKNLSGIKFMNVLGKTKLSHLMSAFLTLKYSHTDFEITNLTVHIIHIEDFRARGSIKNTYTIHIEQSHSSFDITVMLSRIIFRKKLALSVLHLDSLGRTAVTVVNCSFTVKDNDPVYEHGSCSVNSSSDAYITHDCNDIKLEGYSIVAHDSMVYTKHAGRHIHIKSNRLQFIGCHFINNSNDFQLKKLMHLSQVFSSDIEYLLILIIDCVFHNNHHVQVLSIQSYTPAPENYYVSVYIRNVTFMFSIHDNIIMLFKVPAYMTNTLFRSNNLSHSIINAIHMYSHVDFNGYNEFSNNTAAASVISSLRSYIKENTILNFTLNTVHSIFIYSEINRYDQIKPCVIQYISKQGNLDDEFQMGQKLNYSIIIDNNSIENLPMLSSGFMHCTWDLSPGSAFISSIPFHVNKEVISGDNKIFSERVSVLCLCTKNDTNCTNEELGPFYPGQTAKFGFVHNNLFFRNKYILVKMVRSNSELACLNDKQIVVQLQSNKCNFFEYTVKHGGRWCIISMRVSPINTVVPDLHETIAMYTVILRLCPLGFSLHPEGYCQCDPILSSHIPSLTTCNIDQQTIPCPGNAWISAHTINNSHSYYVSLHCPFDYCLPHPSHLNLAAPDLQCQFNRSGMLCGQCQSGLSAVFGSSQCKSCSNAYFLIILPIGVSGLLLVVLLFTLNITVTNGNINSFLLYVNVVSINTAIFFKTDKSTVYVFTALANLDLGINTCFYSGMDDYTKTWLQLVFPVYLVLIATSLIMASRYSAKIQRLTARRALPVLATLFLLSYTKVLLTVSNVLFSYTSITHLPSNYTTLLWSVDTSVPLFGVKFTILFIACLILFLILVPFNVVLIFTKKLSYFKVVTYFKPLLDAYQGPYLMKFYYWTGLQLLIRAIFFALTALDRNVNMTAGIFLIGVLIWVQERLTPFKSKANNNMELLCLFNLLAIFVISLYTTLNQIAVNVFVSLAMIQLLGIILWHVKCRVLNNNRLVRYCQPTKMFSYFKLNKPQGVVEARRIELVNEVPEVAFNYAEFQNEFIGINEQ